MPPKRVTTDPGTKGGAEETKAPSKSSNPVKKSSKTTTDKANPFRRATKDMSRAGDVRRQRNHFNNVIAEERAQKEREIKELHEKIEYYRKDNDKILRQQTTKFGLTLDNLKFVKEDLHQARSTNDSLLRELDARKEECDKLHTVMNDVIRKINNLMLENNDLHRERKIYEEEREQVARNEIRIHDLIEANKQMRSVLLKNKINPNTDASQIKVKTASHISVEHLSCETKLPVIYNKNNLLSFRSAENSMTLKSQPRRGILRRTKSTSQGVYMSARECLTRHQRESWMRRQSVDVYL